MLRFRHLLGWLLPVWSLCLLGALPARAQNQLCYTSSDMDVTTRATLEQAAQQVFALSQRGDFAGLRAQASPSLASSFGGVEAAITQHQPDLQGAQANPTAVFLLDTGSNETVSRAEFFCGIYNSPDRVAFAINNLPPGKYGVITESVQGGKAPLQLTVILHQGGAAWRLAGYYVQPQMVNGHDAAWFLGQANSLKASGPSLPAYLMYYAAWILSGPVEFESNVQRDKIADAMQTVKPANWPALTVAGKTYHISDMRPEIIGNDLDVTIRYQAVSDVTNTAAAFQDNKNVMLGVLQQYPALRDSFAGLNARAVDTTGRDYGTLLAMKDVK
jgi:hypothetical protein